MERNRGASSFGIGASGSSVAAPEMLTFDSMVSDVNRLQRAVIEDEERCHKLEELIVQRRIDAQSKKDEINRLESSIANRRQSVERLATTVSSSIQHLSTLREQTQLLISRNYAIEQENSKAQNELSNKFQQKLDLYDNLQEKYKGRLVDPDSIIWKKEAKKLLQRKQDLITEIQQQRSDLSSRMVEDWNNWKKLVIEIAKCYKRRELELEKLVAAKSFAQVKKADLEKKKIEVSNKKRMIQEKQEFSRFASEPVMSASIAPPGLPGKALKTIRSVSCDSATLRDELQLKGHTREDTPRPHIKTVSSFSLPKLQLKPFEWRRISRTPQHAPIPSISPPPILKSSDASSLQGQNGSSSSMKDNPYGGKLDMMRKLSYSPEVSALDNKGDTTPPQNLMVTDLHPQFESPSLNDHSVNDVQMAPVTGSICPGLLEDDSFMLEAAMEDVPTLSMADTPFSLPSSQGFVVDDIDNVSNTSVSEMDISLSESESSLTVELPMSRRTSSANLTDSSSSSMSFESPDSKTMICDSGNLSCMSYQCEESHVISESGEPNVMGSKSTVSVAIGSESAFLGSGEFTSTSASTSFSIPAPNVLCNVGPSYKSAVKQMTTLAPSSVTFSPTVSLPMGQPLPLKPKICLNPKPESAFLGSGEFSPASASTSFSIPASNVLYNVGSSYKSAVKQMTTVVPSSVTFSPTVSLPMGPPLPLKPKICFNPKPFLNKTVSLSPLYQSNQEFTSSNVSFKNPTRSFVPQRSNFRLLSNPISQNFTSSLYEPETGIIPSVTSARSFNIFGSASDEASAGASSGFNFSLFGNSQEDESMSGSGFSFSLFDEPPPSDGSSHALFSLFSDDGTPKNTGDNAGGSFSNFKLF